MGKLKYFELIKARKSCRAYTSKEVPTNCLEQIIEAARIAPSACNSQPWFFHVIKNPQLVKVIGKACKQITFNRFCEAVPAFIVICDSKANILERIGDKITKRDFIAIDIGIVTNQIVLAATALDLGTCILGAFNEQVIRETLGLTDQNVRLVVAIGYPDGYPKTNELVVKKRKKTEEIVKYYI